ncbi:CusA/CzcA family heavy metal efflux RND transporter [Arachidicoccus ginsenosidivorans]
MLDKIIKFSIQHKLIIGLFTLGLIAWGIFSLTRLPIDAVPDITNNQVQIITSSPSNGATDIERFVTFPIEQTMSTIPGKEEIRSFSRFGLSVVTVIFKDNIDVYWARQQVSERLAEAKTEIPDGMGNPELGPVSTGLGEIYQYVVRPKPGYEKKYSDRELRSIQDWVVRRQLLGVPGVADVSSFGGHLKQYEVALNPDKLRAIGVSISEVFNALALNNQNTGGAYIDKKPNAYFIRSDGLIKNLDDIRNIVVKNTPGGTPILIKDVGTVQYGSAIRYGAMTYNDDGETVGALVLMLKGANASKVIGDVKERIAEISKTLPQGVEIDPFLDRSKLVGRAISTVTRNLAEGALIVIFVLVVFLGNLRAGLIVASVIPLSMLFAISLMNVFGVSGNLMSLGAIDFGLIVDGAVIIVETVLHQLAMRKPGRLAQSVMDHEVHYSANKMMSSATFGQIIILIVYFPILALTGIEGKMFRPMAETVAFAIIGALILSLTYVPMMSALFLSKKVKHKRTLSDRIMEIFQKAYTPLIHLALKRRILTIVIAIVLFIGSLVTFKYLGAEFIPSLDEGDFAIEMRVMTGSSLSQTVEATQKAAKVLKDNFPEVKEVVGKIGSSEIPTDPMPVEAADVMVILKDKKDWTSASNKDELAEKMQAKLEENVPGVTFGFQQPIQMRFNELISGAKQDLVVKVFGDDLDMLAKYAEQIGDIAQTVKGSADIYVEQVTGLPQIVVHYNRSQIARFGLNIAEINRVIQAGFAGTSAGLVFEGERRYDLVIRLEKENRQSIEDIKNLSVTTPAGIQVPISQLADVEMEIGPNQIQREDTRRRIMVGINVRGRDVNSLVQELQQKIDQKIKFEPGYSLTYGGAFKNLQEASARLSIAVPVALLLIFFLLFISFNSFKQALLIFTAIPLSAIGGVFALWIRGMPFSISAGIGFIALFGVAVLNGIVLIAEFNSLKKSGITNLREIVIMGTRVRLRPVLMTATVASLGFFPMALSHGSGAEVQKPLATVVIGGLITATFLTLLVLPVLYTYFEGIKWKKMKAGATITVLLVLMFSPLVTNAQTNQPKPQPQTLEMIIQKAVTQNASVKSATLDIHKQEYLRKTATDFGKTNIEGQYGQSNSRRWDTYFSVNQNIPNPGLFGAQKKLANARIKESKLNVNVVKNDLIYNVKSVYYQLNYLLAYRQLLYAQDTVYQNFLKAADLRYKTGESTLLEAKTAQTQLDEIKNVAAKNEGDILIAQKELQTLLNSAAPIAITDSMIIKADAASFLHPADSLSSPVLKLIQQKIEVANHAVQVRRAEAGPDFSIGYFNQSIIGMQPVKGQEIYFGAGNRFWGVQASISIPLFYKPYKNKIKAAKVDAQIAQKQFELYSTNIRGKYDQAISEYLKQEKSVRYYEASALPNAEFIRRQAQSAFQQGEIQYVELLQALRTYSEIRSNYLQTVHQFNRSVIELQYLSGKNN